jgi:integrase/recombinase XerD
MKWNRAIEEYRNYLVLEKALSNNTVDSYINDVQNLKSFCIDHINIQSCREVNIDTLRAFLVMLNKTSRSSKSQARIISGMTSFFDYLTLENLIETNPCRQLDRPKYERKLPDTLSQDEINTILKSIDLSKKHGERNRTIVETLYSCGLRVSELVNLKCSNLFLKDSYMIVVGKGYKQRLIPLNKTIKKYLRNYITKIRAHQSIEKGHEDYVFLNNRGKKLTRMMIFTIVKRLVEKLGLQKTISPHTFRHSFASHLLEGGADLRAIQSMLGHESISTTEIYLHIDRRFIREEIIAHHPRR